ncbi:MAG: LCP family protein [Spirochaetales bacterium]|nr:LCP family protein [Spirochaetales bacterium]
MKKKLQTILIILSAGLFAFLLIQNWLLHREMDRLTENLTGGLEQSRTIQDRTSENVNLLAAGTNQLLFQNGLTPLALDYGEEEEEPVELDPELVQEKQKDVFYTALDYLMDVNGDYDARSLFEEKLLTDSFQKWSKEQKIELRFTSTLSGAFYRGEKEIVTFRISPDGTADLVDSFQREAKAAEGEALKSFLEAYGATVKANKERSDRWSAQLAQIPRRKELSEIITQKEIKLKIVDSTESYDLLIRLSDYILKEKAGVLKETGELYLGSDLYSDWESFEADLFAYLEALDGRTDREVRDDEVKEFLLSVLQDQAFLDTLEQKGLTLSNEIRQSEDTDYYNWDFYDSEGKRVGSFALLQGFGEIYLLDGDDVVLRSLRTMTEDHVTVDLDSSWQGEEVGVIDDVYSSAEEETYMVVGSHERNADTIILVHANSRTGEIKMISIPRDLWFKNRKLNSVYRYYGIHALAQDVSELTGLNIEKYMAIDMYAFIDVINIMGGIDVVLDEPLIDPTYHIKENGTWTTLNYPAGQIHLDGLGALRVARSRHSTNDYSRSRRQQMIIGAIFDKLTGMGLSDADKLTEFVRAAVKYTETNISPGTLVRDVMKYRKSSLGSRNVVDATNVLYESYSNLYRLSKEEQKAALADDNYYLGAWIVLPRDNNYNLIKWHIRRIINE